LAALRDARQAASLAPNGVSEQVALAVLGFDKDNPAASVGALGTLAAQSKTQTDPQVRFHLGLLFFWIKRPEDAAGEFQQVRKAAPHSIYAPIAGVFQRCMVSQTACLKIAKSQ
jgi:hypothetical protein